MYISAYSTSLNQFFSVLFSVGICTCVSTGSLNETTKSPTKLVHRKSISFGHTNGERLEHKSYKLIDAVDRNGRLIPFVTIYVPIESKDTHEHNSKNYKLLGRSKHIDPKRTVIKKLNYLTLFIFRYLIQLHLINFSIKTII